MITIANYDEFLSKFFRDVLRGVDASGTSNAYTTTVHHPKDYDSDLTTLKAPELWIDPRSYIIVGVKKNVDNGPIITIESADVGEIKTDGQGSDCHDLIGGVWHIRIDASAAKPNQRSWRDKMSNQVLETLNINRDALFDGLSFSKLDFTINNVSGDDNFIKVVQINFDLSLG